MSLFFSLVLIVFTACLYAHDTTYIIVHGTWAQSENWCQEGGDFFDMLYSVIDDTDTIIPFLWSGSCFESARTTAAHHLALIFESIKTEKLVVIAHSHGGNVALKAAEFLEQYLLQRKINVLILLGTPHYYNFYFPESVHFIFNFFSFGDQVQPIFNLFKRDIPASNRAANIALTIQRREPTHERLHHPLIALHIPDIVQLRADIRTLITEKPHTLHLVYGQPMRYEEDHNRHERVLADIKFQERLPSYLLWGPTESLYFFP